MPQTIFSSTEPSPQNGKKKIAALIIGILGFLAFAYAWSRGWIS